MESFADEDKIRVFFCDYGNIETVSRVSFRATYPDMWQLPPQAVPCRLSGKLHPESYLRGSLFENLMSRCALMEDGLIRGGF